jgi:hypothetical protein
MAFCPVCGNPVARPGPMCGHHTATPYGDDWAIGNRIMRDFVHRRVVPESSEPSPAGLLEILFDELAMPV